MSPAATQLLPLVEVSTQGEGEEKDLERERNAEADVVALVLDPRGSESSLGPSGCMAPGRYAQCLSSGHHVCCNNVNFSVLLAGIKENMCLLSTYGDNYHRKRVSGAGLKHLPGESQLDRPFQNICLTV